MKIIIVIICSYLLGSISFSIIIGHLVRGIDIRKKGSCNAGATNVFRILGWKWGVIVFILDFLKSFLPLILINRFQLFTNIELVKILMILSIMLGHVYPIWFSFKGGKGVSTAAGGISAIFHATFPFSLTVFILTVLITKYVSLASLLSAWTLPIFYYIYTVLTNKEISIPIILFFILISILITIFHKKNIVKLYKGTESKITLKKYNKS